MYIYSQNPFLIKDGDAKEKYDQIFQTVDIKEEFDCCSILEKMYSYWQNILLIYILTYCLGFL